MGPNSRGLFSLLNEEWEVNPQEIILVECRVGRRVKGGDWLIYLRPIENILTTIVICGLELSWCV